MEPLILTHPDGTIEVLYDPTPKQQEFHSRTEPNVLLYGGRGSGKSVALRWEAHIRAMSTPNFSYAILRRTYPELQKSHLMFIGSEMKKLGGYFHHTDKVAMYPNGSKGFYSHCSNEEDVLNLLSAQFAWMGFDELSTFPWDMFVKLAASVRVGKNSGLTAMVRAATNPFGASSEDINRYFVLRNVAPEEDEDYNPDDWYSIKANLEDNPHIDADQYRKRFAGLNSTMRKAWVDGEFTLENALFDFQPIKNIAPVGNKELKVPYHVVPATQLDFPKLMKAGQIYRAYDHGYFPDPAVCLWIAHLGNRYVVFYEKTWFKTVASDIAADIIHTTEDMGIDKIVTTYCDPSMDIKTGQDIRTLKDIFAENGIYMECSINDRALYAASVHQALAEEALPNVPRLQISSDCRNLIKTLPQQRYNPKRPQAMADHKDDHWTVALAYFLISHSSEEHRRIPSLSDVPKWMQPKKGDRWTLGRESTRDNYSEYN